MDIASYIADTLETYNRVAIKNLGTIILTRTSAQINADTQTISPPEKTYSFETGVSDAETGYLIELISTQRNLSEPSTNYFIDKWVELLKEEISEKKVAYRKPLGYFSTENGVTILNSGSDANGSSSSKDAQSDSGLFDFIKLPFGKKQADSSKIAAIKEADDSILHTSAVDENVVVPAPAERDEEAVLAATREMLKKEAAAKPKSGKPGFFARLFKGKPKPVDTTKPIESFTRTEKKTPSTKKETEKLIIGKPTAETSTMAIPTAAPEPKKPMNKKQVTRITALIIIIGGIAAIYFLFGSQLQHFLSSDSSADTLTVKTDTVAVAPIEEEAPKYNMDFGTLKEGTRFQIIIGSYDNAPGAARFMKRMQEKGIKGVLHILEGDGRFRIAAGGFTNLAKTKAFLSYYQDEVAADCWILQL